MSNASRIAELRALRRPDQTFLLGDLVRTPTGAIGRVDTVYIDLKAAIDLLVVPEDWYERLAIRPKTQPYQHWYGVILPEGAVFVGERDLVKEMP